MIFKKKERVEWIDALRGLAMFFVIWGHTYSTNKTIIKNYIYSFHLPLFFFISGLTFGDSDKLSFKEFAKKRIKGLLIPYLIINIICYFFMIVLYNFDIIKNFGYIKDIAGIFYSNNSILPIPCGPAWFLVTLFLSEILFYFLKKNTKNDFDLGVVVIICGLISYVNSLSKFQIWSPLHISTALTGVVFYYLGYLFIKNIKKFDFILKDKLRMFMWGGSLGLIAIILEYNNRRVSFDANVYGSITLFYFSALFSIFAFMMLTMLILQKSHILKNIGKNTIFYLAYHDLILFTLRHYYPNCFKGSIKVLLLALCVTLFMYPFALLCDKYFPIIGGKIKKNNKIDKMIKI